MEKLLQLLNSYLGYTDITSREKHLGGEEYKIFFESPNGLSIPEEELDQFLVDNIKVKGLKFEQFKK